jgi:protocatechuate 3,4-dioxygenase beta subunit
VVLEGADAPARGEILLLTVRVVDENCRPVAGATVDLWQACASGKYDHPSDPNDAALDPNFQYHAILTTGASGEVRARTIKPGAYPNDPSWVRPPHIHFKVSAPGFAPLTTQMYFAGEALNAVDHILARLPADERAALTVEFTRPNDTPQGANAIPEGTFTVVLRRR